MNQPNTRRGPWHHRFFITLFSIVLTVFLAPLATAETTAQGVVFNDRNGNGVRDAGERGIKGVGVSNGRDVVETNRRGEYTLPVTDDTILFVIKPSGWMTPVDRDNLPRFYYIHKPAGSPESKYAGVAPTGPLPESVDFPLQRHKEPTRFRAVFFGDTQARNSKEVDYIAHDVVEELVGTDAAFGLTLGDIVFNDLNVFDRLNAAVGRVGIPWYNVQGNHDTNQDAKDDTYSSETFQRVYGPPYYAFNYGKVHVIVLDDIAWDGDGYHAELGADQLEFVRNDLAIVPKDHLIVVTMHISLTELEDRDALFAMLADRPNTFSAAAHWHIHGHIFLKEDAGWQQPEPHHHLINATVCGSWWAGVPDENGIPHTTMPDGAPNGYTIVTFDGADYTLDFKAARRPASHQMNIYAPETVKAGDAAKAEVIANVFNGNEYTTVEMCLGGEGPWTPMSASRRQDPYYLRLKELEAKLPDGIAPKLPKPADTGHIWVGNLPVNPEPGAHLIHVRATDMFGRTHTGQRVIHVE
jgi:C terminal of Calcineurin-like phosphoesterase/N terminal of Calcineurin-like phosphoesterase